MEFNKQTISHFTKNLYQALTSDIRELVDKNSTNEIRFINDNEIIERERGDFSLYETQGKPTLQEVLITNIPFNSEDGEFVSIIDKWDQTATNSLKEANLKNEQSGVDGVIFHYHQETLFVYLIELKSTLDDDKLKDCVKKFELTISRLSLFVPVLVMGQSKKIDFENIKIEFKAIIFFVNRGTVMSKEDVSQTQQHLKDLYNAYHNRRINAFGKGTVQIKKTLFTFNSEAEKIKIRFIGIQDRNENLIFEEETTQNKIVIQFENMIF